MPSTQLGFFISAVLVAISIPIFSSQLEKAREATDLANIRAAYAECAAEAITGTDAGYYKKVTLKQTDLDSWIVDASDVAGVDLSAVSLAEDMFVNVSSAGVITLTTTAATGFVNVDGTTGG